jgi:hypothetical protein
MDGKALSRVKLLLFKIDPLIVCPIVGVDNDGERGKSGELKIVPEPFSLLRWRWWPERGGMSPAMGQQKAGRKVERSVSRYDVALMR